LTMRLHGSKTQTKQQKNAAKKRHVQGLTL